MPNVVLKTMASAVSMVLTPFLGLSGAIGKREHHFLLVERDSEGLAPATAILLENVALRAALSRRAQQWVEQTLDVERTLDCYAALSHGLADEVRLRGFACRKKRMR